jgi:alpha-ketoglutarate-dependent taurine dioxygenase
MVQAPPSPTSSEPNAYPLSAYARTDLTTVIGTAFDSSLQLSALLEDDAAVASVARLISERGVVVFRTQELTLPEQKTLARKLGELTNRPEGSGLHKHPISEDAPELGAETSVISSEGCATPFTD